MNRLTVIRPKSVNRPVRNFKEGIGLPITSKKHKLTIVHRKEGGNNVFNNLDSRRYFLTEKRIFHSFRRG